MIIQMPSSFPRMASPWLYCGPEGLYWAVRHICDQWSPKSVFISENGCSADDPVVDERIAGYHVTASHHESLHAHDAVAEVSRNFAV